MRLLLTFTSFIFALVLTGCQSLQPSSDGVTKLSASQGASNPATVLISFVLNAEKQAENESFYDQHSLAITQLATGETITLQASRKSLFNEPLINNDTRQGEVYLLELAPGDYEVSGFTFTRAGNPSSVNRAEERRYVNEEPLNLSFTVEGGQSYYLGSIVANTTYYALLPHLRTPMSSFLNVEDEQQRDAALLDAPIQFKPQLLQTQ